MPASAPNRTRTRGASFPRWAGSTSTPRSPRFACWAAPAIARSSSRWRESTSGSPRSPMTIRPPAPCAAGHLTLYRLYDVGYVIDLARAFERLSPNSPERARPARGGAQAIQIANPPVTVQLGTEPIELEPG